MYTNSSLAYVLTLLDPLAKFVLQEKESYDCDIHIVSLVKLTFILNTQIVEVKMKRQLSAPASINPQKPMELLRNVVWLEEMPPDAVDFVTSCARIKMFDAGETITRQGEELTGIYLIVSGMVKVLKPWPCQELQQLLLNS